MGRKELAVFGGLLSGIGQGMIAQDTKRMDEERANRDAIIAMLKEDGMSAGGKRDWDTIVAGFTKVGLTETTTDWPGVAKLFDDEGNNKFADRARRFMKQGVERDSDEYLGYEIEGEDAYDDLDPFGPNIFHGDVKKDVYGGLDKEPWIKKYADDKWRTEHGAGTSTSISTAAPAPGTSGIIPITSGGAVGTEASPHKPTSQADFEKIKKGEFYLNPSDGKIYVKN